MKLGLENAQYAVIDPQAIGSDAVARAFENQVAYCRDNNAPTTAMVCQALRELLDSPFGGQVMERVRRWEGPALADALPLRVTGGLHTLHLSGDEPELAPIYDGDENCDVVAIVGSVLERHQDRLLPWLDGPPQTNEAGRSSNFIAAMHWLAAQGLPSKFALNELGSSAGINLMLDRYRYDLGGVRSGPAEAAMRFSPEWKGPPPPDAMFEIMSTRGCDVSPVDLTDPDQALRLKGYIWPEAKERFGRLDAAIAAAHKSKPEISPMDALSFVDQVLSDPVSPGMTKMIMHSVVWQYIPQGQRSAIRRAIVEAGETATSDAPLAWVSVEANRDTHRHELKVRHWPGSGETHVLAVAHPHGAWIEWLAGR